MVKSALKIFFILFSVFMSGCSKPSVYKEARLMMDTFCEISCTGSDSKAVSEATKAAFKELERIGKAFNGFDPESEVSSVNKFAGIKEVTISQELFDLIERSIYYSKLSGGSFDITVAPLVELWKKSKEDNKVPDKESIEKVLECIGYENVILNRQNMSVRFSNNNTRIDLGGIAKGYAVDRAKDILVSHGIKDALINLGGNMYAIGKPPGKDAWHIGIQHPREKSKIAKKISLKDRAISTSGDYERFFIIDGQRFSHIINPLDGKPSRGLISVTIITDSAEKADALSTAVFVMGKGKSPGFIRSLNELEAYIFDENAKLMHLP